MIEKYKTKPLFVEVLTVTGKNKKEIEAFTGCIMDSIFLKTQTGPVLMKKGMKIVKMGPGIFFYEESEFEKNFDSV